MTLWTPADLTSTKKVGWFDAQDAASITQSSGLVSAWANKFGTTLMANLAQATSGLQPAYSATGFNSSYGGITSVAKAMNSTITGLTDEFTVIVIGTFLNAGGGRFISVGSSGGADWDFGGALLEIINDGGYKFHPFGQYIDFGYVGAQGTSPQSWAAQFKNAASLFRVNGAQPIATNTSAFGFADPARFAIGDDVQGDRTDCNITYAEIIILRGASADDIARAEGYAMWKRGLQGTLDAAHPYKSAAPTTGASTTYTLTAAVKAIPLTKRTANLTFSRALPAVKKTVSITKRATNLVYARIMPAAKKTITITKQAAILTHGWSMPAVKKSVPITKQVTNLIMARRLAASLKSVPITKRSANLVMGYRLVAAPKSVPITKRAANLIYSTDKTMQAAFRTIPITKYPVGLILVPVGGISSGGNHSMKIAVQGKK